MMPNDVTFSCGCFLSFLHSRVAQVVQIPRLLTFSMAAAAALGLFKTTSVRNRAICMQLRLTPSSKHKLGAWREGLTGDLSVLSATLRHASRRMAPPHEVRQPTHHRCSLTAHGGGEALLWHLVLLLLGTAMV